MLTMQSADCGVRQTRAKRQREKGKSKKKSAGSRPVLYPSEMFIAGIWLQRPHSPVLGGILGNVVFC